MSGKRPEVFGAGPLGRTVGDTEQWVFPDIVLTEEEKVWILAAVTGMMVEILFDSHLYTFGGRIYKQAGGGPIGLRGTCAVARLIMNVWDTMWEGTMRSLKFEAELYVRYMDDGRIMAHPVRKGWRWEEGRIRYRKEWFDEDKDLSKIEVTRRLIHGSMQGVVDFLKFTTETEEEFKDGWLPTLDLGLQVRGNKVWHRFYEKPTTSKVTVQERSAMESMVKSKILSNDLTRGGVAW